MIGKAVIFRSFNGSTDFKINDRVAQPELQHTSPYWYVSLDNADGLYQADISYESHPLANIPGEKSGDVFRRGKTITLSGFIYGADVMKLYTGAEYVQQMFAETLLRKLIWYRTIDNIQVYMNCRVSQDLAIIESFQDGKLRWPWVVGLRADQPFTYNLAGDALYPSWQV